MIETSKHQTSLWVVNWLIVSVVSIFVVWVLVQIISIKTELDTRGVWMDHVTQEMLNRTKDRWSQVDQVEFISNLKALNPELDVPITHKQDYQELERD